MYHTYVGVLVKIKMTSEDVTLPPFQNSCLVEGSPALFGTFQCTAGCCWPYIIKRGTLPLFPSIRQNNRNGPFCADGDSVGLAVKDTELAGHAVFAVGNVVTSPHVTEHIHGADGKAVSAGCAFFIVNLFNRHLIASSPRVAP